MRTILFFDLPTITAKNRRDYRKFVKNLIKIGFYRIQESVFVKMSLDGQTAKQNELKVKSFLPPSGNVMCLTITENQFASISVLIGEMKSDVINDIERTIEL